MKYIHCDTFEFLERTKDRKIVLFGAGQNLVTMDIRELPGLSERVYAVIDNGDKTEINAFGRSLPVYKPDWIKTVTGSIAVVITTCIYCKEMAEQLIEMDLPDTVELYFYSMMSALEPHPLTEEQRAYLFDASRPQKIPKIIHGFWFSGDEKPDAYKKCFDSWSRVCPDYEIREWTKDNFDYKQHPFLKKAVEVGAWAAATDFARVATIYEYGGIYLDMDVEVLKPMDNVLGHESVFPFYSDGIIDPAAYMAVRHNPIVEAMLKLFDAVEIPETKEEFKNYYRDYFLPIYMSTAIKKFGVEMNGDYQCVDDNLFIPRYLMMPRDCIVYEDKSTEDTFVIHRSNIGWKEDNHQKNRMINSREIVTRLTNGEVTFES